MKLLLVSNSGVPKYEWFKKELSEFVGEDPVTFISAATVYEPEKYFGEVKTRLALLGIRSSHLILDDNPEKTLNNAKVFFNY